MPISPLQFSEMLRRTQGNSKRGILDAGGSILGEPCDREVGKGGLHEQIEEECRRRQWPYIHARTDRKSTIAVGAPDFVIAIEFKRTVWCECKTRIGKQTTDQRGFQMMLERLGHTYILVRSFAEFMEKVNLM